MRAGGAVPWPFLAGGNTLAGKPHAGKACMAGKFVWFGRVPESVECGTTLAHREEKLEMKHSQK